LLELNEIGTSILGLFYVKFGSSFLSHSYFKEGIPEAIIENKNGYLVEPKNYIQLAEKLIKALKLNQNKVEEIRERNIKLAKERFSWEKIIKKISKIYIE